LGEGLFVLRFLKYSDFGNRTEGKEMKINRDAGCDAETERCWEGETESCKKV
jgi:hypothetical protein